MLPVIHPITGSIINTHFRNSVTHRFDVSWITCRQSLDSCLNPGTRPDILQTVDPLGKKGGFTNFHHSLNVAYRLHIINKIISDGDYIQIARLIKGGGHSCPPFKQTAKPGKTTCASFGNGLPPFWDRMACRKKTNGGQECPPPFSSREAILPDAAHPILRNATASILPFAL